MGGPRKDFESFFHLPILEYGVNNGIIFTVFYDHLYHLKSGDSCQKSTIAKLSLRIFLGPRIEKRNGGTNEINEQGFPVA